MSFVALGFVVSKATAQISDEYLKSIQGEAETVTLDEQTRVQAQEKASTASSIRDGGGGGLENRLTMAQFESELQKNYIGSYLFYKRLSDAQKKEVFSVYLENPTPDAIREIILKVSKQ